MMLLVRLAVSAACTVKPAPFSCDAFFKTENRGALPPQTGGTFGQGHSTSRAKQKEYMRRLLVYSELNLSQLDLN